MTASHFWDTGEIYMLAALPIEGCSLLSLGLAVIALWWIWNWLNGTPPSPRRPA